MKNRTIILFLFFTLVASLSYSQRKEYVPGNFEHVVVSPNIEVIFEQGDEQKVKVMSITEPLDKFNVDLKNGKLHLYLDGAKITSNGDSWHSTTNYKGTVAKVVVVYKNLKSCDLRGAEHMLFKSPLNQKEFKMAIYGETEVVVNRIELDDFKVNIYGESVLHVKEGKTKSQKFTAYGDSKLNLFGVNNENTKLTTYGEGEYYLTVNNDMKITSFGESNIHYFGDPTFSKKVILGETTIRRANH